MATKPRIPPMPPKGHPRPTVQPQPPQAVVNIDQARKRTAKLPAPKAPPPPTPVTELSDAEFAALPAPGEPAAEQVIVARVDRATGQVFYRVYGMDAADAAKRAAIVSADLTITVANGYQDLNRRISGVASALTDGMHAAQVAPATAPPDTP